ncbi:hypothetical protein [Microbacterium oleivorans]|uniref:Uncharacterized protein n=1 Tax=Microbacterium oleivorans TaxID=273677 RepID=A0A4R5YKW8_9MICO|nr:hypothetical protein [Microbacterium oleivorans]TDL44057.1 hypothetical protein E2R54_12895 [Microbacterium oleivorans]
MAAKVFIVLGALALVLSTLAIVVFAPTWEDTVPAWIGGVGGVLGALASLYAIALAAEASREHVSWSAVPTRRNTSGVPQAYELVNVSKSTVANIVSVDEMTGDIGGAIGHKLAPPFQVNPGASFPIGVDRSMANHSPTVAMITWEEKRWGAKRFKARRSTQNVYL